MKIELSQVLKFTRASEKDREITLSVNEIAKRLSPRLASRFKLAALNYLNNFVIDVNGIPTLFQVGRKGRTLYSTNVHPKINTPDVGQPSFYWVDKVRVEGV